MEELERIGRLPGQNLMQRTEVLSIKQTTRRAGLAEYVYSYIKDLLLDGRFDTLETLPVENFAKDLNVSRQPVMDSLKRLALEGFVLIVPQVGCQVRKYSPDEISDFFRLFAEGEALIAELLAERADRSDIAVISSISEQIGELRELKTNPEAIGLQYRHLNRRLHFEMRRASRSIPVAEVVESLGDRSDFFVATSRRPLFADRLKSAHAEHEAIIEAVRSKDPQRARDVMKQHILQIGERLRNKVS
ncbi:hypothetical protein ASD54_21830 [Rhizobium sp. Root149]|uniref:GntR family transcriptional regulator n=1 Tax=Rhizobium sp. Root149 TaxID=1736473 RepID=UPI000712D93D|nr:GntR family transcriptional regulator [Rhizobium sp. Root149]KQZ46654.1 hypothetical protein ASD54_21830 [Rhizobium sp. Root149]